MLKTLARFAVIKLRKANRDGNFRKPEPQEN